MNSSTLTVALMALTLLIAILFGPQYIGVLPWLRSRRKNKRMANEAPPTDHGDVQQALQHQPSSNAAPTQATVPVSQALAAKGFKRAARWAESLPLLLYALGMLTYFTGFLTMLLSSFFGGLGSSLSSFSNTLLFAALFLILLSNLSPVIVVLVVVIVSSIRNLTR